LIVGDWQDPMRKLTSVKVVALVLGAVALVLVSMFAGSRLALTGRAEREPGELQAGAASKQPAPSAADLDLLLAPVALYPDPLLAQMLLSASDPAKVKELNTWLKSNQNLKGTQLQDAAVKAGFEPSFVALVLFPQIVNTMAVQEDWTTQLGQAFAADRSAVFASIQRLRTQAQTAGNLKTTPQQEVTTQTTTSGQQVIVIEPANPQVIYVPQYNTQTVYTQTVVVEKQSSSDVAVAGLIGFTAGIVIGAAIDNDYYYGPYGWRGGAYMYNDAWDDYYDAREDAREDWQDHREDLVEERGDRASDAQEQRTERRETGQEQRTERQETRSETARPESQAQREQRRTEAQTSASQAKTSASQAKTSTTQARTSSTQAKTTATQARTSGSYESRGYGTSNSSAAARERSGARSDAFSGYSSGTSTRAASSRGQSSRSSSRGGGGGRRR
jgi:Protein of unknown function (DUF3300)